MLLWTWNMGIPLSLIALSQVCEGNWTGLVKFNEFHKTAYSASLIGSVRLCRLLRVSQTSFVFFSFTTLLNVINTCFSFILYITKTVAHNFDWCLSWWWRIHKKHAWVVVTWSCLLELKHSTLRIDHAKCLFHITDDTFN